MKKLLEKIIIFFVETNIFGNVVMKKLLEKIILFFVETKCFKLVTKRKPEFS